MANEYMSPGGFLALGEPAQTGAIGMLGGSLAGRNDDIGLGMINRAFRDSDLANLMAQEDYKMKQDEVPTKAKANEADRIKSQEFIDTSSDRVAAARSNFGQVINDNKHKAFAQQLDSKIQVSNELSSINRVIGDSDTIPPHMMSFLDDSWKKAGLPPLPQDSVQARQVLKQFAQMADQRIPLMEKERDRAADLAKAAMTANASMYHTDKSLEGTKYVADKHLEGLGKQMEALGMDRVMGQLATKAAMVGLEGLSRNELEVYRGGLAAKASVIASQNVGTKMLQIIGDPSRDKTKPIDYGQLFNESLNEASGGVLGRIDKLLGNKDSGTKKETKTVGGVTYEKRGNDWYEVR